MPKIFTVGTPLALKGLGAGQERHADKDGRDEKGKTMVAKMRTKFVKTHTKPPKT
jgi:hypothetical protein